MLLAIAIRPPHLWSDMCERVAARQILQGVLSQPTNDLGLLQHIVYVADCRIILCFAGLQGFGQFLGYRIELLILGLCGFLLKPISIPG